MVYKIGSTPIMLIKKIDFVIDMTKKIKMEYIGKERIFTNNSAFENNRNLEDMTNRLLEISNSEDSKVEDIYIAMGEYVATIFEGFDPKEMLDADDFEIYLVRGLNTLKNLYKIGKSKKEIEETKKEIIEKSLNDELFRL